MIDERKKRIIAELGLDERDFKPDEEKATIEDVVEALSILTEIVLGGENNGWVLLYLGWA